MKVVNIAQKLAHCTAAVLLLAVVVVLAGCGPGAPAVPDEPESDADASAEPSGAAAPDLIGTTWQWAAFEDTAEEDSFTLDDPENYTLMLNEDDTLSFQADCNVGAGSYTLDDDSLNITLGPTTLAECGPDSRYGDYLNWLGEVVAYVIEDGQLFLTLRADRGSLVFEPADAAAQVTGTVTYRPRIALPPDAVITVQLQDVSLADAAAEMVGEQVIPAEGRQVPFAYAIPYDPAAIEARHRYSMAARIEDGDGTLLFHSDTNIPVITDGNPTSDVEIVVRQVTQ
jgi:putative lipoprotein